MKVIPDISVDSNHSERNTQAKPGRGPSVRVMREEKATQASSLHHCMDFPSLRILGPGIKHFLTF